MSIIRKEVFTMDEYMKKSPLFTMPNLLLCGIGDNIIYDKENEFEKIKYGVQRKSRFSDIVDGKQRTHTDCGSMDFNGDK